MRRDEWPSAARRGREQAADSLFFFCQLGCFALERHKQIGITAIAKRTQGCDAALTF
jgi:hypothetical protein